MYEFANEILHQIVNSENFDPNLLIDFFKSGNCRFDECPASDVVAILNINEFDEDLKSEIAQEWISQNIDCGYDDFRKISIRIPEDSIRCALIANRAMTLFETTNEKLEFLISATQDGLLQDDNEGRITTQTYLGCGLGFENIAEYLSQAIPFNYQEFKARIFSYVVNNTDAGDNISVINTVTEICDTLNSSAAIGRVLRQKKVRKAFDEFPEKLIEIYQKIIDDRRPFLKELFSDKKLLEFFNEEEFEETKKEVGDIARFMDLATAVIHYEINNKIPVWPVKFKTQDIIHKPHQNASSTPIISFSERKAINETCFILPQLPQMNLITDYVNDKIKEVPKLNRDKIANFQICFDEPEIAKRRREINSKFKQILLKPADKVSGEEVCDLFELAWQGKKVSEPNKEKLTKILQNHRFKIASLFQDGGEVENFFNKFADSVEGGFSYLKQQVISKQIKPIDIRKFGANFDIKFDDEETAKRKSEINEAFKYLLREDNVESTEYEKAVVDFFEKITSASINESQHSKLRNFFASNRDEIAYLFSKDGMFEPFVIGCAGSLDMGCVANIATHAQISLTNALIEEPQAQILYTILSEKIIPRIIRESSNDLLGDSARGANLMMSQELLMSIICPEGMAIEIQKEFFSDGKKKRDQWEFIGKFISEEQKHQLFEAIENSYEDWISEKLSDYTFFLTSEAEIINLNEKILDRRTYTFERDECREKKAYAQKRRKTIIENFGLTNCEFPEQEVEKKMHEMRQKLINSKTELIEETSTKIAAYLVLHTVESKILSETPIKEKVEKIFASANPPIEIEGASYQKYLEEKRDAERLISLRRERPRTSPINLLNQTHSLTAAQAAAERA